MQITLHQRSRLKPAQGQILLMYAFTLPLFIGALLLGIDLSHLRADTERIQRAANAGALAGVVFLPNFQDQAFYRAQEEVTKNGFTTNTSLGVTVTPNRVSGYSYRLSVTISAPISNFFGHVFGLGSQTVTRKATAEFLPPLEMGGPDYVLGYPRFPSYLTSARSPANFYLNQNGQYTWKENGDPYSPLFESIKGYGYGPNFPNYAGPNPCITATTCTGTGAGGTSPIRNTLQPFNGYKYVISLPYTQTVLVKLFDPYSELNYDAMAACWDAGKKGSTNLQAVPFSQSTGKFDASGCNGTAVTPPASPLALADKSPTDSSGNCILGSQNGICRNEAIEIPLSTEFNANNSRYPQTSLQFSLTGPAQSLLDPALNNNTINMTPPVGDQKCTTSTNNCVIAGPFTAGNDPTTCDTTSCTASSYAYHFVNYAILHGPGYFQLNVNSVQNTDSTYGESNNAYGIAVCDASTDTSYTGNAAPLGTAAAPLTSDPVGTTGWNAASCPSPNDTTRCPNPGLAAQGQCVQIYAVGRMPLYNYLAAGSSLVPLGYVPAEYQGRTIDVNLFDPGDVGAHTIAPSTAFTCTVPIANPVPPNSMELLTPAGDLGCPNGTVTSNHVDGHTNTITGTDNIPNTQPGSIAYSWTAKPNYLPSNYTQVNALQTPTADIPLDIGDGTTPYNGSWVMQKYAIPNTYSSMVNGTGAPGGGYGGYWKMLYRIGGDAHDATTWALTVEGSTVHLVTP